MKILKIRFENIHSLKGEHEIDFASGILAEAGLFAITGPTGSGKSTLLDVITLALYNRIARVDRPITNTVLEDDGGIMTRNMSSCYAEVDYAVNGKAYRSHWSIERNRNNNLNNRKQELVDVATGTILETGTKTPDKNQEIIRLSYEQFVKAMVLSQGEFSKLLQAPRNERNKLLEDITGAKSYRNIGVAVFQRFAAIREKVKMKNATLEGISFLSKEEIAQKSSELKDLEISKPLVLKRYEVHREKIHKRNQLNAALKDKEKIEKNISELKGSFTAFEADNLSLAKHTQLVKYAPYLANLDLAKKEVEKLEVLLGKKEESKILWNQKLKVAIETTTKLVKSPVKQEDVIDKLELFRRNITQLQAVESSSLKVSKLHQNQVLADFKKLEDLGFSIAEAITVEDHITLVVEVHGVIQKIIDAVGVVSVKELDETLVIERKRLERALELVSLKKDWHQHEAFIISEKETLVTNKNKLKKNKETLRKIVSDVIVLEQEVGALKTTLEHQQKHLSLAEHRAQLVPDKPCPLCGAIDHPYATTAPYFDMNKELLTTKEALLKEKSNSKVTLESNTNFIGKDCERILKVIAVKTTVTNTLEGALKILANKIQWDYKDSEIALIAKGKSLRHKISNLESAKRAFLGDEVLKSIRQASLDWQKNSKVYEEAKAASKKQYSGSNIDTETSKLSNLISDAFANLKAVHKQLAEVVTDLKTSNEQLKLQYLELMAVLKKEGLQHITELRTALLAEETAAAYRAKKNELDLANLILTEKKQLSTVQLEALLVNDNLEIDLVTLEAQFVLEEEQWSVLGENIGKISQLLENDTITRERYTTEQTVLENLKKDQLLWKTMNDLIGDSYGNKFSNFVQDLTLEQLIGYANKRLSEFTDRYMLDIPTAAEAEKSDTLKIFDTYMGNARRSVKTLSGGETFLVSLAMAFALSDIASRNVKIESLFIDEGFGTLDPETLDQAITILEKMQNEGDRSVGVISHVGALKERITTQVQLEKSSLGHSQIRVVQ
ncbi:MAG: exonuclease SbcC [Maribacter sp.]|jgi:exonuclease SbcC